MNLTGQTIRYFGNATEENVDIQRVADHLSKAITFRTISNADPAVTDWSEFQKFHIFLVLQFAISLPFTICA